MRDKRIDFYKGLLILSVVLGHTITALQTGGDTVHTIWLHKLLRTFDMPFFIAISGYFLNKSIGRYIWWKNCLNKLSHILVPIIIWSVIYYLISAIAGNNRISIMGVIGYIRGGYWFLWAALISTIIVLIVNRFFGKASLIVYILIELAFHLISKYIWNLAFVFPFFIIGFYYDSIVNTISEKIQLRIKGILAVIFIICLCFWDSKYNTWEAGSYILKNTGFVMLASIYRFITAFSGVVFMKSMFDVIYRELSGRRVKDFISSIGMITMEIYLIQAILVEYMGGNAVKLISKYFGKNIFTFSIPFLGYVLAPIVAIASILLIYVLTGYIKKLPVINKYIFGFKCVNCKARLPVKEGEKV